MKPIRLSAHARDNMVHRGTTEDEIADALRTAAWSPAERGRFESWKDFPYNRDWNGRTYATKTVRPIFVDDPDEIVVVTVYVYYF